MERSLWRSICRRVVRHGFRLLKASRVFCIFRWCVVLPISRFGISISAWFHQVRTWIKAIACLKRISISDKLIAFSWIIYIAVSVLRCFCIIWSHAAIPSWLQFKGCAKIKQKTVESMKRGHLLQIDISIAVLWMPGRRLWSDIMVLRK